MQSEPSDEYLELDNLAHEPESKKSTTTKTARRTKTSQQALDLQTAKLQKLQRHLRAALDDSDPEVSLLGVTTCDLMKLAIRLSDLIDEVLQHGSTVSQFETLMRGTAMMLKLTRQIDRFTQLRLIISEARSALESPQPKQRHLQ